MSLKKEKENPLIVPVQFTESRVARMLFEKITNSENGNLFSSGQASYTVAQTMLNILLGKKKIMLDAITFEKCKEAKLPDLISGIQKLEDMIAGLQSEAKKSGLSLNNKMPSLNEDDRERINKLLASGGNGQ